MNLLRGRDFCVSWKRKIVLPVKPWQNFVSCPRIFPARRKIQSTAMRGSARADRQAWRGFILSVLLKKGERYGEGNGRRHRRRSYGRRHSARSRHARHRRAAARKGGSRQRRKFALPRSSAQRRTLRRQGSGGCQGVHRGEHDPPKDRQVVRRADRRHVRASRLGRCGLRGELGRGLSGERHRGAPLDAR